MGYQIRLLGLCSWMYYFACFSFMVVNALNEGRGDVATKGYVLVHGKLLLVRLMMILSVQLWIGGLLRNATIEDAVGVLLLFSIWNHSVAGGVLLLVGMMLESKIFVKDLLAQSQNKSCKNNFYTFLNMSFWRTN